MPSPTQPPAPTEPPRAAPLPAGTGGWLLLVAVLLTGVMMSSTTALPWILIPIAFSLAAVGVSIMVLVRLSRAGVRGFIKTWTIVLMCFAGLSLVFTLAAMALQPILGPYQECMQTSVTLTGVNQCQADYQQMLERLGGSKP